MVGKEERSDTEGERRRFCHRGRKSVGRLSCIVNRAGNRILDARWERKSLTQSRQAAKKNESRVASPATCVALKKERSGNSHHEQGEVPSVCQKNG